MNDDDLSMLTKLYWLRDTVGVDIERMFARALKEKDGREQDSPCTSAIGACEIPCRHCGAPKGVPCRHRSSKARDIQSGPGFDREDFDRLVNEPEGPRMGNSTPDWSEVASDICFNKVHEFKEAYSFAAHIAGELRKAYERGRASASASDVCAHAPESRKQNGICGACGLVVSESRIPRAKAMIHCLDCEGYTADVEAHRAQCAYWPRSSSAQDDETVPWEEAKARLFPTPRTTKAKDDGWPHRPAGTYDADRHRPECACEACDAYEQGHTAGFQEWSGPRTEYAQEIPFPTPTVQEMLREQREYIDRRIAEIQEKRTAYAQPAENSKFPVRACKSCGFKTVSTSTVNWCPKCKDEDGLRPRHFLTYEGEDQCSSTTSESSSDSPSPASSSSSSSAKASAAREKRKATAMKDIESAMHHPAPFEQVERLIRNARREALKECVQEVEKAAERYLSDPHKVRCRHIANLIRDLAREA